ncbi:MAG: alpha/beta family hydrolase [Gammaproteobacteria bacterium]|nr:alpha/beta family hydrolase [Gammaproteobacteria bacterium]
MSDPIALYSDPAVTPATGERFLIPGSVGVLEAQLDSARADVRSRLRQPPIAVVCHPHPLHGGTLTNKVAHTLAKAFVELGVTTLRFNFRGVGASQGGYDQGRGEVDDLFAAVAWLRARHPQSPLWLAGFSFGAYVALMSQATAQAERLLLVAPPVAMFDFSAESGVQIPWMVVQGGADEIVDPQQVSAWVQQQANAPEYCWIDGAGHFFHGQLVVLKQQIHHAWSGALQARTDHNPGHAQV